MNEKEIRASMTSEQIQLERRLTCEAIDGAMAFGYQNTNPPPSDDHWLAPFWKIGRKQAELEASIADTAPVFRCNDCGGFDIEQVPETMKPESIADTADYKRMFEEAVSALAAIDNALGIDPDEAGGAAPILEAIERLRNDGECRSCVDDKCVTGPECVTLGRDAAPMPERADADTPAPSVADAAGASERDSQIATVTKDLIECLMLWNGQASAGLDVNALAGLRDELNAIAKESGK
jgi:hypothetical protein